MPLLEKPVVYRTASVVLILPRVSASVLFSPRSKCEMLFPAPSAARVAGEARLSLAENVLPPRSASVPWCRVALPAMCAVVA